MSALTTIHPPQNVAGTPRDPAGLAYPAMLTVELALKRHTVQEICSAYGISKQEWSRLKQDPLFLDDLRARIDELKRDGMSFKMKARLQAEAMLEKSWDLVHDQTGDVPVQVKADLIKFTIRAAGLDGSKDQAAAAASVATGLQINFILK